MFPFSLFLASKYLKPKRSFISVVTLFSVVGVLLGVAILVIVLSVMTGFDNMWRTKILSFKPHLTVTSLYGTIEDDELLCEQIAAVEGVTGVAASIEARVMLQREGRLSAPVLLGVTPERASSVSRIPDNMSEGVFDIEDDSVVIGVDMASQLGLIAGDEVLVHSPMSVMAQDELHLPEALEVSGIFDLGMRDFDGGFVLTSIGVARDLVGLDSGAYSIYVMTEDPFQFGRYAERVQAAIGRHYVVRTWQEVDKVLFDALAHEKTMMFILLAFITVVAIFCVTVTLIVIVVQKTSEIGLLKALGVPTWKILLAFLVHGWVQCLVGTLAGIGTGLLVLTNLPNIVKALARCNVSVFPKEIYGLSEIPWETSAADLIRICVMVMVVCTLSCIIPVLRAAFLEPVEAFREE
ncbi:MAG: ABC transporter permease [Verrucomicrobia bacterium]|jgi:lipoprotein-releasing system permease protein|nr:ABC transporter permease [Verrucomicrobiota bacterium]